MSDDDDRDEDFTPHERQELREFLRDRKRVRWLTSTLRVIAIWIAAVVAAVYATLSILRDGLRALGGH